MKSIFIPIILIVIGIFFLAFPFVTRFGGKIKISRRRQLLSIAIGILLTLIGISLYFVPAGRSSFIKTSPPVILGVTIRASQETGGLVYYQEINFYDEDGNTERVEWELVDLSDASQRPNIHLQNGVVDAPPEIQKIRATVTKPWPCEGRIYVATLEVTLADRDGHRSEPVRYRIDCK